MKRIVTAAAMLAAMVQVESLQAECSGGARNLPTTVSSQEQEAVEAAARRPVDHIACSRFARGMSLSSEISQVREAHVGYVALTDEAVLFVANERRTMIPGLYRRALIFRATFDEITSMVAQRNSGWDTHIELAANNKTSSIQIAQGRNGDNLLEALRMRVIAACSSGALVTPSGVTCP